MTTNNQTNVAIRIFKEQFDIIKNLPEQDRALVLYATVLNAFIQFENQTDYQNENQNGNQIDNQDYLYLNHISESISGISNNILVMFNKTIRAREFSDNYGGRRKNAGRKSKNPPVIPQANLSDNLSVSEKPKDKTISLGELGNVKLTQEQYNILKEKYSAPVLNFSIDKLDTWLGTTATKHNTKNHYAYFKANSWVWEGAPTEEQVVAEQEHIEDSKKTEEFYDQARQLKDKLERDGVIDIGNGVYNATIELLRNYRSKKNPNATLADIENDIGYDKVKQYIERRI